MPDQSTHQPSPSEKTTETTETSHVPATLDELYRHLTAQQQRNQTWVSIDDTVVQPDVVQLLNDYTGSSQLVVRLGRITQGSAAVIVTGTSAALFGQQNVPVRVLFIQDDFNQAGIVFALKMTITATWKLTDAVTALGQSLLGDIDLTDSRVILSSGEYFDTDLQQLTSRGFHLQASHTVSDGFPPFTAVLAVGTRIVFTGSVTQAGTHWRADFRSVGSLSPHLSLPDIQVPPIAASLLFIETRYSVDEAAYLDRIRLEGATTIGGVGVTANLEFLSVSPDWQLTFVSTGTELPGNAEMLGLLPTTSAFAAFPSELVAPDNVRIAEYVVSFGAYEDDSTDIALQLDVIRPWNSIPVLQNIRELIIQLFITRYRMTTAEVQSAFSALVTALVTIGTTEVDLLFHIRSRDAWRIEVKPRTGLALPTVSDIAALIGHLDLNRTVPDGMNAQSMLHLDTLTVDVDIRTPQLKAVALGVSVSGDWHIIPSALTLSLDRLSLQIINPTDAQTRGLTGEFAAAVTLGAATTIPIHALKPTVDAGWTLVLARGTQVEIPGIADLLQLVNAASALSYLPSAISSLRDFVLSDVVFAFTSQENALQRFSFIVGQRDESSTWPLIADKLFVTDIAIEFGIDFALGQTTVSGYFAATLHVLTTTIPIVALKAGPQVGWNLRIASDTRVSLPTLADVFTALDASSTYDGLPSALKTLPSFAFADVEIQLKPESSEVQQYSFEIGTTGEWVLLEQSSPLGKLAIGQIAVGLSVDQSQAPFQITGSIMGAVVVIGIETALAASRTAVDTPWVLTLHTTQPLHFANPLSQLASWMWPNGVTTLIPATFMPFPEGFDLTALALQLDLSGGSLEEIRFTLQNAAPWKVIDPYVVIDSARVTATIQAISRAGGPTLTGHISGILAVGDAQLQLAASRTLASGEAKWTFTGQLVHSVTLDFRQLIDAVHLSDVLTFPRDLTLPTLQLTRAMTTMVPTDGKFSFSGTSSLQTSTDFANTTFNFLNLGGRLDIEKDAQGEYQKTGAIMADFDWHTIRARLALLLGKTDTVFVASLVADASQMAAVSLPQIADGVLLKADGSNSAVGWSHTTAGLDGLTFAEGYLFYNHTKKQFFVYGTIVGLANLVFLAQQVDESTWGYVAGLTLGADFTFAHIYPALAPIDQYLKVTNAGLLLASYRTGTTDIADATQDLAQFPDKPPGFTAPVAIENLPDTQIDRGVYFYAHLEFRPFTLFGNLVQLGNATGFEHILVSALIGQAMPPDASAGAPPALHTRFEADLPDITLAETIHLTHTDQYAGIHLGYSASNAAAFTLTGRIVIQRLFSKDYAFDGSLTVDQEQLHAHLVLVGSAPNTKVERPFDVPGIVLEALYLSYQYTFATQPSGTTPARPAASILFVGGTVAFGSLTFTGRLVLEGGSPVLVSVLLDQDLSIGQFFAQCINASGAAWPSQFIDLVFLANSALYYYKKSADPQGHFATDQDGQAYADGFNVAATIKLTLLEEILIRLTVSCTPAPQRSDTYTGISARAALLHPIDLGFLVIASRQQTNALYVDSPVIVIKTGAQPEFGFEAGFNFLGTAFGEAALTVMKLPNGDAQLRGELTAAINVEPLGRPSFHFTFSRSEGFKVEDWPGFEFVSDVIDFISQIREIAQAANGTVCGTLAALADHLAFQTTYAITPAVGSQGTDLVFKLTGHCHFHLANSSEPFLTLDFPVAIQLTPPPTSFQLLPERISQALASAARQFAVALLNDAEKLALFLTVLFGEKAVQIALELVCNGILDAAEATAVQAGADALAAAGGTGAGGAAAVTAAAGAIHSSLSGHDDGGHSHDGDQKPGVPVLQSLRYENGQLIAAWPATVYATGYIYQLLQPDGTRLGDQLILTYQQREAKVSVSDPALPSGTYTGQVRAVRGDYMTAWASMSIEKLPQPTSVWLAYAVANDTLEVTWPAVQAPHGYHVVLMQDGGRQLPMDSLQSLVQYDASALSAGTYTATVFATGSSAVIPGNPTTSVASITKPTAPSRVSLSASETVLTVGWQPGNAAPLGYSVSILLDGNALATLDTTGTSQAFDTAGHASGEYTATVQAKGDANHLPSQAVRSTSPITKLGQVSISDVTHADSQIRVHWTNPVGNAAHYMVQLVLADHQPLGDAVMVPAQIAGQDTLQGDIPIATVRIPVGAVYARVRAVAAAAQTVAGEWSVSQQAVVKLAAPHISSSAYRNEYVIVQWERAIAGATSYQLVVIDGGSQVVSPPILIPGAETTARISIANLPVGPLGWRIKSETMDIHTIASEWAYEAPGHIQRLPVPTLNSVSYYAGQITVRWNSVLPILHAQVYRVMPDGTSQPVGVLSFIRATVHQYNAPHTGYLSMSLPDGSYQLYLRAVDASSMDEVNDAFVPSTWVVGALPVQNRINVVLAADVALGGMSYGITTAGNYAFVADARQGLHVLDITDPTRPTVVQRTDFSAYSVVVSGPLAFVVTSAHFYVLNLANLPRAIPTIATLDLPSTRETPMQSVIQGRYIYVALAQTGLQVISIADPAQPRVVGHQAPDFQNDTIDGVAVRDNYLYVAHGLAGLYIYDISNPVQLRLISTLTKPSGYFQPSSATLSGNYLYLPSTAGDGTLYIINVADVRMPTIATAYNVGKRSTHTVVVGNLAYVAGEERLTVLNVADAAHPIEVTTVAQPGSFLWEMHVQGQYLFVAAGGMKVFRIGA